MSVSGPAMGTCGGCGAPMDPSRATYDKNGNLVCAACASKNLIEEGDSRAVSSTVGSAVGILIGGLFSMTCFNPFLIVSVVTLISAVGWLVMIFRNGPLRAKMGAKFVACLVAVILGLGAAALPLLLVALGMTALAVRR